MKSAMAATGTQTDFNISLSSQWLNVGLFSAERAGQPSTRQGAFAPIDDGHNRLRERAPFGRFAVLFQERGEAGRYNWRRRRVAAGYFIGVPGRRFSGGRID
jgi:hypothetical protein